MDIRILNGLNGAEQAKGLTVVIDVFRAFTVECFLFQRGASLIIPVGKVEDCLALKAEHPDYFLVGERQGKKLEGFDVGNTPTEICTQYNVQGKTVVHSTSAGVQGIVKAINAGADEVITCSLVNASAVAKYILKKNPEVVSIVAMGLDGLTETREDTLCADYLKDLLNGKTPNIHSQIADLKNTSGAKFFDPSKNTDFPEPDFFMCLVPDIFDFVLKVDTSVKPFCIKKV